MHVAGFAAFNAASHMVRADWRSSPMVMGSMWLLLRLSWRASLFRSGERSRIGLQRHDQRTSEQDPLGALTALVAAVALQRAIDSGERLEAEDRFAARGRCVARARRMERRPLSRSRVSNLAKAAATRRCSSRIAWSSPMTGSRSR